MNDATCKESLQVRLRHEGAMPPHYDAPAIQIEAAARIEALEGALREIACSCVKCMRDEDDKDDMCRARLVLDGDN